MLIQPLMMEIGIHASFLALLLLMLVGFYTEAKNKLSGDTFHGINASLGILPRKTKTKLNIPKGSGRVLFIG